MKDLRGALCNKTVISSHSVVEASIAALRQAGPGCVSERLQREAPLGTPRRADERHLVAPGGFAGRFCDRGVIEETREGDRPSRHRLLTRYAMTPALFHAEGYSVRGGITRDESVRIPIRTKTLEQPNSFKEAYDHVLLQIGP